MITPGRLARFTTQALANSLWAYATLRFYPTRFLDVSLREVRPHVVETHGALHL